LLLAFRRPIEIANPLLFFAMVVALFPLGLGPAPEKLAGFAPGVLWITALLSNLLTSDGVFRSDFDDGSLEQLLLAPQPLFLSVVAYIGAHWLTTGLLLALVSPVFALMLNLPVQAVGTLVVSLLLGTAVLSLVGGIGAALTVGLKRGGMLISLLILPLYMPVLIFGSAAVQAAIGGFSVAPYLAILGALLCVAIALAPLAMAAGLRISIDA
jgi:heme exporter protein B